MTRVRNKCRVGGSLQAGCWGPCPVGARMDTPNLLLMQRGLLGGVRGKEQRDNYRLQGKSNRAR